MLPDYRGSIRLSVRCFLTMLFDGPVANFMSERQVGFRLKYPSQTSEHPTGQLHKLLPTAPSRNTVLQHGNNGNQDERYVIAETLLDAVEKLYMTGGPRQLTFDFVVLPFGRMAFSGRPCNRMFRLVQKLYQPLHVLGSGRQDELLFRITETSQP